MSFFPSSSYLRKLIRTSEERLEFLESEQLLAKNTARKEEILKVKSELKTEIVKLKQDLKITEDSDPVKVKKTYTKTPAPASKYVPFNDWSQERLLLSSKTATSRTKQYGSAGDTFRIGDKTFELTDVSRKNLWDIAQNYYLDEGAKSPEEFIEVWNALHPKGFDPEQVVYFHKFRQLTPETVHLKELLTKPSLTQEESKKAVSLAQTIYRTQSRNVLTARENIALNTQVRKNLGESYGLLIQEGEIKAAKVAAFRKRQLEEELNILGEIARKTDAPEIPALTPATDKNFVKNTDNLPFITYEPRPLVNYVVKPREIDVSGFAPQWFSRFDKKEPTFFADWMDNQEENLRMVLDEKTGLYSAMISRGKTTEFDNRVVNFPEIIEGTIRKKRTEKELAALAKKERSAEQKQILEDAKKLFIKVGGKLEEKDFWEYHVNDKGEVYQRLAFFRTPEGALVYAGDNEKIMIESRLSQAVPETELEDVSFYDSEKIKKRIEERAKAYDKEQYDQDTILTNRGLPVKDIDKLRRETDKFERDFMINFMINHPDQLKPWLDAVDPKTIRYLNDVLGGEEVLRRKWLPQIEFKGKLYEVGRTKASYELPEGLPPETAELLKRDPEKYTLLDIGISPVKIEEIVKGPAPERTKNTVIYIVGHDFPKDPKEYETFIQRLRTGKEPYFAKLGEEIEEEAAKKPEIGLGMSVSSDILDLLKGKDVPKGIQVSSPLEIQNDIQVVRYVQPLRNIASFTPLQDAWKKGFEDITEQAKTVKGRYPDAAIGRIIKLKNAPTRFGAAQEGVLLTDEGKEIQFVAYKKDNPPLLEYNNRYSFKNPGETIEGSKTISRITQENAEKTNFPSQQITTRGIVYDVMDVNDPTGTAQYGHMISPADGKFVKFTTFSRDNPPVLKKNEAYTIYNAWLQGFQTNTGKIELNLNIKPENIYPERAAISKEQKALAEELRANTYRSEVHPTEYKPFRGQPPKPQKTSSISDPVVATTVENGEIIVITSSGKRIPGKEYAKQYTLLKPKKETGVAYDDETLNKIEEENPLDEDQLFMLGLLPIGALGITPEEFPGEKTRKDLRQTVEDARAGLTNEEFREQSQLAVQASMQHTAAEAYSLIDKPVQVIEKVGGELIDSALNLYRATPLKTIFTVKEAREYLESLPSEEQKYAQQHPYETGLKFAGIQMLGDVGTILKPLSNTGYAVGGIASGEGPLEGIMKERIVSEELGIVDEDTSFWEWKKPERAVAGFLTDVVTDPLSWVGTGAVKKVPLPGKAGTAGLDGIKSFLTDEVATFTPETAFDRKAWKEAQDFNKKIAETKRQTNIEAARKLGAFDRIKELSSSGISDDELLKTMREEDWYLRTDLGIKWSAGKGYTEQVRDIISDVKAAPYTEPVEAGSMAINAEAAIPEEALAWQQFQHLEEQGASTKGSEIIKPVKQIIEAEQPISQPRIEPIAEKPQSSTSDSRNAANSGQEPITSKEIWSKLFRLKNKIAEKEAVTPHVDWKQAGLYALAGATGVSVAAIGLAGLLDEKQNKAIQDYLSSLPVATEIEPEASTQETQGQKDSSLIAKLGETAMGVRSEVISSPLGPTVGAGWEALEYVMDKLQTFSYAEGGLIKSAQTVIDNPDNWNEWKFYGYQWKMTPADVLGVYDPDDPISLRTVAGLGIDIGLDPMTYLTLGNSAAVKIGSTGLGRVALNPKGIKTLKKLSDVHGEKNAEQIFSDMLVDPKFRKQVQAAEGVSLRGWGPFFGGQEYELISKPTMEAAAVAPKSAWDQALRSMATSGNARTEKVAEYLLRGEQFTGKKADLVTDWLGRNFVPNYELDKIPRPQTLAPREPEFAERFMRFKHTARFRTQELTKRMEFLRDEAKTELGNGYKEIISKHLEAPVLRESAGLSPKTIEILDEMTSLQKGFAESEIERGLLDTEIEGYLKHMLSDDARKYMNERHLTSTEVFMPLRNDLNSAKTRGYRGSIEEINKLSQEKLGFNLFDPDPFKAVAVRGAESYKATETHDLLEYVAQHYGNKVTEVSDPANMAFPKHTSQLMNLLPPDVSSEMLKDAKDILKKLEPDKEYTNLAGIKFRASVVLRLAADNKVIREKLAFQAAREVVEGEFGKKIVTSNPTQEEIARTAVLLDQLQKGIPEKQAIEYAKTSLRNVEIPIAIRDVLEPAQKVPGWYDKSLFKVAATDYSTLGIYDRGLRFWKWGQTVPFPAYHSGNIIGGAWNGVVLGETNPLSTIDALRIAYSRHPEGLRKSVFGPLLETQDKTITTALGESYTFDELYNAAGNLGVFGQPGMMDIEKKMEFSDRTDVWAKTLKTASKIDPANVARSEENVMRLSMFVDRVKRGDTLDDAARYATKYMFDYLPESKTQFQRNVLARTFPFFTWQWNNVLLQSEHILTNPGKYAALGKTGDALMGNEEPQEWAEQGYLPWLVDEGKFAYMRTPVTDMGFYNDPKSYTMQATAPFIKAPAEALAGRSFFTGKEYKEPVKEALLENIPGRSYSTYNMLNSSDKTPQEKAWKGLLTVGTARTKTQLTLEEQFRQASRRKEDFTWEQRFEGWKRDEMASPLSGIPDELQGGHIQAVMEGGKAEMSNFLTMTTEENLEQTSSQVFRTGLPEKKFLQDKFWEEMKVKEGTKLAESTLSTTEKLEKEGKWVNNAVREKLEYDAKKAINIQLYSRELAKIRMQLDWAERRLRNEQASMDRKRKDPDFKGDKWSERQIQALLWFIPRYQAQYTAIERLREQERTKEFELPEQIIQGEDYDKGMLGKEREVNIRGKGPALADPEQIKNMVKYDEIALERAVILEDVAIIDLPKYVPKYIRDSIEKPEGPEWKEKQDKAAWYARVIWDDETEVPAVPAALETQNEGWAVSPFMPMASVAMINMGTGRKSTVLGLNKPLKTPASPLESSNGTESPGWNLRLPSVSDVVGLFLPHPAAAEPISEEAVQQQSDMAKEAFLESDEFITAVQSIVTDYLDRGIER
ncbi:MAG: hypothetical protein WA130_16650 [Candidatus Methanoperedens sp.]